MNWSPTTPGGPHGTATFGISNTPNLSFSADTSIGGWTFNAGASNYTFTNDQILSFNSAGIVINGGSATITNNFFLGFFNSSTAGSATITNRFGGLTAFNDSSSAGSATIINRFGGETDFNAFSTAGNAAITNRFNGLTTFNDSSSAGSATITNRFGGETDFYAFSTAGNATITNRFNGLTTFNDSSSAGGATIVNRFGGETDFNAFSTAANAIITNRFGGVATFNNLSSAGNAVITNNSSGFFGFPFGGLVFFDASTAGNATITTNSGAVTAFFDNSTGGLARFTVNGSGVLNFSFTAGPHGDGQISAGSIEGNGQVFIGSNNTLSVGGNNLSTEFSGVIADSCGCGPPGPASLVKVGTGTLILSGVNSYTGTTDVNGGTLIVNGSIASSSLTRVNNGGTLAGTGTVGNTQVNNGGTLAPGNSPGTITVQGNLAFQSGAFYLVQLNPTTASFANVTGTASLAGTVEAVLAPGSYTRQSYDILHAALGLGGTTFNAVTVAPPNFAATLSYTSTDVFLNLAAALSNGTPLNQNQQSVANAINAFFNNGGTLPPGFFALFNLTDGNLANALTLLSGEVATGAQQPAFQLMNEFLGIMLDPFVDGRAGIGGTSGGVSRFAPDSEPLPEDIALAYSKVLRAPVYKALPFERRWSVWGAGYGGANRTSGDPLVVGSHDLSAHTAGGAAGLDYRLAPGTIVGFALAGGGTGWSLAQGLGSGRGDAFQAGVYAKTYSGPFYLAGALAYTQHWMSTDRIAFAGDRLTADFNAQSFGGRAEAGYRIANPIAAITPYAAVQAQNFRTPTYNETDVTGGGFGLTYNAHNASDTRTELGARFDRPILLNWNAVLALRGKLAWAHDWITDPNLIPTFEALPGASFLVQGATPAKNSALTSAGAELRLVNGISVLAKFDGQFAAHSSTYGGSGAVRYVW